MVFPRKIDGPVAVIGDIHGQVDKLLRVIEQLREMPDYQERWIVFIGDLVDRGPDPCGAIELFIELVCDHPKTTIVSGNHELAMAGSLGLFEGAEANHWGERWIDHYGSEQTFASYGVAAGNLPELRLMTPETHLQVLMHAPWIVEHPDYLFVHSGLDPEEGLQSQLETLRSRDFQLRRPEWLCSKTLPFHSPPSECLQVVVSGHAHVPQVIFAKKRILIDTTGGREGSLSCVLLPENQVINSDDFFALPPRFSPESEIAEVAL
ncbi:metallophosphoesterase [Thalassoglobus sp. JC818]|uniref:metallophosphoesterase n=1 Tax=Thalassoglobus sp. JC818 TaxID=3232136 RepID=UPI003459927B